MRRYGFAIAVGLLVFLVLAPAVPAGGAGSHLAPKLALAKTMETVTLELVSQGTGEVVYRIRNLGPDGIFYGYGCQPPDPETKLGDEWLPLVLTIRESEPEAQALASGAEQTCRWDLTAWQDPNLEGKARFQSYLERLPVPPGLYRLALTYYASLQDFSENRDPRRIFSESFEIPE